MADVFISYKSDDRREVDALVKGLRAHGFSVWWDQDIPPDAPWELTIERELSSARAALVAWSPASVVSENVKSEARRALRAGRLVQVFVEDCEPPLFFGERQGVSLLGWSGKTADHRFQTVMTAVRAIVEGRLPTHGAGSAPPSRLRSKWPIVLGTVAAATVVLATLVGSTWVLPRPSKAGSGTLDPATAAAEARRQLIGSVAGIWDRQGGDCARPVTIAIGAQNGTDTITVAGPAGFKSIGQVITAEAGKVVSRDVAPGSETLGETWEYQPNGAMMIVVDGKGVPTPLFRCPPRLPSAGR